MIFGQDRNELRRMYADAWQKRCNDEPLTPLERQIAAVIDLHPEYQGALRDDAIGSDYTIEGGQTNPFLHMGLHLGLRDQVATDRPSGIATIFDRLAARLGDAHAAEHRMIDALAETLWEAQRGGTPPDEAAYLDRLKRL